MKALIASGYGPLENLHVGTLADPTPSATQVRVRVAASALNPADFKVITGEVKFLHARNFPMVVGNDFAGTVDGVGADVKDFAVGDRVYGFLPYGPGNRQGAFAEYLCAEVAQIAKLPANVSDASAAAAATPALTALQALRDAGRFAAGGRALVTGVSGGVGSLALGVVKRLGGTAVALGSARAKELAARYGCTEFIDRGAGDVIAQAGTGFDVIFDAAAAYRWATWKGALKAGGTYVTTLPSGSALADFGRSLFASSRVRLVSVKPVSADLKLLADWLAEGLHVEVDSTIPVRDVAKGLAKLRDGEVRGRIVVDVANGF